MEGLAGDGHHDIILGAMVVGEIGGPRLNGDRDARRVDRDAHACRRDLGIVRVGDTLEHDEAQCNQRPERCELCTPILAKHGSSLWNVLIRGS